MNIVCITGVAGFLGRYVASEFHRANWRVVGVDTASEENAPGEHLDSYLGARIPDERFTQMLKGEKPSLLVHCAGRASVGFSITNPWQDFQANTLVTVDLLEALRVNVPHCRFVLLSSAAVYGNPDSLPISESSSVRPVSPYGFHKRQAELACEEYAQVHGMSTASLRIFSAYGAGLRRQVVWDLTNKICGNGPLQLMGTGEESRDFVHARDVAAAVMLVAEKAALSGECINLANGQETRIVDVAIALRDRLGSDKEVTFDGVRPMGTPTRWQADITKLQSLGYAPKWTLESGLAEYVKWAKPLVSS